MRWFCFWLSVFSCGVLADSFDLELNDLNFIYKRPEGVGSVRAVSYGGATLSGDLRVEVAKKSELNHYQVAVLGFKIPYVDQLGTFEHIVHGEMQKLNLQHGNHRLLLTFDLFRGVERKGLLVMSGLHLDCYQAVSLIEGDWLDILGGCLRKGSFSIKGFNSASLEQNTINSFAFGLLSDIYSHHQTKDGEVSDLKISTNNGLLNFAIKLTVKLRGHKLKTEVKGSGKIYLERKTNELVVKIDKVKGAGFIPITGPFFQAMQGVGKGRVRVNRPYIRVRISKG